MKRLPHLLTWASIAWLSLLFVLEYVIAERNGLVTALTYIPQHPLALPLVLSLFVSLVARYRRLAIANLLLALFFLSFFLGYQVGLPRDSQDDLRVMTLNLARSTGNVSALPSVIGREKPDVLFFQEANALRKDKDGVKKILAAKSLGTWRVARAADVAILSKYPLSRVRSLPLLPSSGRRMLTARISVKGRTITLACVHFATNLPGATRRHPRVYLSGISKSRTRQARALIENLPANDVVVAGDFNLPPRGLAYRRISGRYIDTFTAGSGFGYTYRADFPVARIDHVFASRDLIPVCWRAVDTHVSDHRAVVVDIALSH